MLALIQAETYGALTMLAQALPTSAGGKTAQARATEFFNNTTIGRIITSGLVILGLVIVIVSIVRVVMNALKGNMSGAIKNLAIGLFLAALFFNPAFIGLFIDWMQTIWNGLTGTVDGVVDANVSESKF